VRCNKGRHGGLPLHEVNQCDEAVSNSVGVNRRVDPRLSSDTEETDDALHQKSVDVVSSTRERFIRSSNHVFRTDDRRLTQGVPHGSVQRENLPPNLVRNENIEWDSLRRLHNPHLGDSARDLERISVDLR
jgi:hypothetical protein